MSLIHGAELTDKDESGFQRVILWAEGGEALITLKVESWAVGLSASGREYVMCDLLDVLQDGIRTEDLR